MEALAVVIVILYGLSLLFIFCYSLIQLSLLFSYLQHKRANKKNDAAKQPPNSGTG